MHAMDALRAAARYWPPLEHSFTDEVTMLRQGLAGSIRLAYLKPLLERCQEQCSRCGNLIPGCAPPESSLGKALALKGGLDERCEREPLCRPEQMLHLVAVVHASRESDLGRYLLSGVGGRHRSRWSWAADTLGLDLGNGEHQGGWMASTGLREEIVGDYIISSDKPWPRGPLSPEDSLWTRWPYEWLTKESYQGPWRDHLRELQRFLSAREVDVAQWRRLEVERKRLQATLAQSADYASSRKLLALIDASNAPVNQATLKGVDHILDSLDWQRLEHKSLLEVLRMEEEISAGLEAAEGMSAAELLTRTGGLFIPGSEGHRIEVRVLQHAFEFRPKEVSRSLLEKLIRQLESGRLHFPRTAPGGLPPGAVASASVGGMGIGVGDVLSGETVDVIPSGRSTGRLSFDVDIKPLVDEFTTRMAETKLSPAEAAQRQAYVLRKVAAFARQYRQDLLVRYRDQRFTASVPSLASQLSALAQPASELSLMLREVADGAGIGPLEGPYYEPLRQELALFRPIVQLMAPDKDGQTAQLVPYLLLVSQLHTEVSGMTGTEAPLIQPASLKGGAGAASASQEGGGTQLVDLLSPLGRVALAMLLEEDGSYLAKVDAWLDKQGILGELRRPFREPFLVARELGRAEVERVLDEQWEAQLVQTLEPLLRRYPFNVEASQELDPAELDVLRRKDGAFWQFVSQVLSPVVEEKGTEWMLRRPLRQQLTVPPRMLLMLGRLSRLSRTLWDEEGKPRTLPVQVRPLPLPAVGAGGYVTMSFFKCGAAAAFGFNQTPAWQEFPVAWWEPRTASVGVELRMPGRDSKRYRSTELSRSSWNCFRLLDAATFDQEQNAVWPLPGPDGAAGSELRLRFGMRGGPWTVFQEVAR
jgi:type VI secretion system protein ImpL